VRDGTRSGPRGWGTVARRRPRPPGLAGLGVGRGGADGGVSGLASALARGPEPRGGGHAPPEGASAALRLGGGGEIEFLDQHAASLSYDWFGSGGRPWGRGVVESALRRVITCG
jgi:hypothetical protein